MCLDFAATVYAANYYICFTDIPVVQSLNTISENFGEDFVKVVLEWSTRRDSSENNHEFSVVITSSNSGNDSQYITNRSSDQFNITYNIEHKIFVSGFNCAGKSSAVNKTFNYGR